MSTQNNEILIDILNPWGQNLNDLNKDTKWQEPDWDFLDYAIQLERNWKEQLRMNLVKNEKEWLEIFPEAKQIISEKIMEWKKVIDKNRPLIQEALDIIKEKSKPENHWFWKGILKYTFFPVKEVAIANRNIKRLSFLLQTQSNPSGIKWEKLLENARRKDLLLVCEHYSLKLHKAGKIYKILCPIHHEKTPSFYVYPPSRFVCFGCDIKGDVIDFVRMMDKCSLKDAVYKLQNI